MRHVFKGVVETNFLVDFILMFQQSDQFVSLGLTFNIHHDRVTGIARQVIENWMLREVNVLKTFLLSVEATDLNRQDQTLEQTDEVFNVLVIVRRSAREIE